MNIHHLDHHAKLTLEELTTLKFKAARSMACILAGFHDDTGLRIDSINFKVKRDCGGNEYHDVELDIRL